uniref:Arrestin_N domain-containing protein n=1 Tax=Meloidogyne hapla TaxID=6305 RepID=A0A1I8BW30_MELHA
MVLCYQGMLSNMGNENYKPAVRFEVNKTEGNIVDYFCQICVHKGICSGDDVDLRGIIIFYDKSTKVAEMYSKKILFSIPADKTLTNSMKTNPVAYLNDYPGIFALKMDMLLGKTENKLTNKKNIVGVGLLQKALVPATTTLQPFHPTPYLYQTSNTHNIQETSNTPTSKYTTPKSECIFKLNPREYNGYGCLYV